MKTYQIVAITLCTTAIVWTASQAPAVVIDDFSTSNSPALLQIPGGNAGPASDDDDSGLSGVIGSNQVREVTLTRTSGTAGNVNAEVVLGEMRFETTNVGDSTDYLLVYDNQTGVGIGDLAADLTAGGTNAFGILFSAASGGSSPVTITVNDGTNTGSATANYLGGPGNLVIPYSDPGYTGPGINFASINWVSLLIEGVFDGDYFISLFESTTVDDDDPTGVPEPSAWTLAVLSCLGAAFLFWRQRTR